jgi:hypothetical protein
MAPQAKYMMTIPILSYQDREEFIYWHFKSSCSAFIAANLMTVAASLANSLDKAL